MAKLDSTRPVGAMTSLMRAAPEAKGPQVLRLARVEAQKVVDERLHRNEVVVGDSAHASIHLDRPEARLFLKEGEAWVLSLPAGTRARVALDSGPEEIVGPARRTLPRSTRGRVTLGATQLLFQLVAAPPVMPAPQLPLGVKGGNHIDWPFLAIAAASFLAHFGFVGAVQADWLDPIVDDDGATAALIVEAKNRPNVPPEEPPTKADKTDKNDKTDDATKVAKIDKGKTDPKNGKPGPKAAPSPTDVSALSKQLDDLEVGILGSNTGVGPAQSSVFKKGSKAVDGSIDEVAKKNSGVDTGNELKIGNGPTGPIVGKPGFPIGDPKGDPVPTTGNPPSDQPKAPTPEPIVPPPVGPGVPKDANGVLAGAKWRFKACYTKELSKNDSASGTVKVTVETDAGGKVISAAGAPSGTLSPGVAQCVQKAFYALKFSETPEGTTFSVPIVLQPTK